MRVTNARIISTERLFGQTYLTWLGAPPLARGASPGQFLMLRCGPDSDPLLPRPMSSHRARHGPDGRQGGLAHAILFALALRGLAPVWGPPPLGDI